MGALHAGHASLMEMARRECGTVVASIFVNPTQFDEKSDYALYPRVLESDGAMCTRLGVDLVFAPDEREMYPGEPRTFVEVGRVGDHLCGKFRPGHFRGVATVVLKLLNIVQPDRAYFGEKDAQQLALIRRMVKDLDVPVEIVGAPTVREADGLALSSRNARLNAAERRQAPALYRALRHAAERIAAGATDPGVLRREALEMLAGVDVEYLEIVDEEEMQPVARIAGPVRVAAAIRLGATRLIDNVRA
jgi:pantoate--beta-alanine ligase